MMDAFDALRVADGQRREWIWAARSFERAIARVHDAASIRNLERRWESLAATPLAPAEGAWRLVSEALDEVASEAPLTFEEACDAGLTGADVVREMNVWMRRERERRDQYDAAPIREASERDARVANQ